ncbi:MAG: PQQ-binding-like beta-propeller repeat protein [Vicinamibacterales bacterium]
MIPRGNRAGEGAGISSLRLVVGWLAGLLLALVAGDALTGKTVKPPAAALVWENTGQPEAFGAGLGIAAAEGFVVSVGNVCTAPNSTSTCKWFVRAHDAQTGETIWEDRQDPGRFDRSQSVAIESGRVFASGWYQLPLAAGRGSIDFVVRAYDLRDGTLLWEQHIDRGTVDFAEQIAVKDGRVFAVGRVRGVSATSDYAVFAFDAKTGSELWESVVDVSLLDVAFAVTADRNAVYSAGLVRNVSAVLVTARDARTGQLLWQDEIEGGQMFLSNEGRLIAQGGRLFVAGGIISPAGDEDLFLRAYDARNGAVHWTLQLDAGGNDEFGAMDLDANRLMAVGSDGCDENFLSCSFSVRALDSRSGTVLWTDRFQAAPGGDANAGSAKSRGGRTFAGGNAQGADGIYQWSLRAFDASSGTLANGELIPDGLLNALAVSGDLFYATGSIAGEFVVRAYRATGSERP